MRYVLALLFGFVATNANAQQATCDHRAGIVEELKNKYDETLKHYGLVDNGTLVFEIFTSPKGTFTAVITNSAGVSCYVSSGTIWQTEPDEPAKKTGWKI